MLQLIMVVLVLVFNSQGEELLPNLFRCQEEGNFPTLHGQCQGATVGSQAFHEALTFLVGTGNGTEMLLSWSWHLCLALYGGLPGA